MALSDPEIARIVHTNASLSLAGASDRRFIWVSRNVARVTVTHNAIAVYYGVLHVEENALCYAVLVLVTDVCIFVVHDIDRRRFFVRILIALSRFRDACNGKRPLPVNCPSFANGVVVFLHAFFATA